jgi:hypothetical protein
MRFNGFEEFQEYPKMLYDKDGATKVVAGPGEEQKAGLGMAVHVSRRACGGSFWGDSG